MNLNRLRLPKYRVVELHPAVPNAVVSSGGGSNDGAGLEAYRPLWLAGQVKQFITPCTDIPIAGGVAAFTSNWVYVYPFVLGVPTKINCLQFQVGNTSASPGETYLAIYDATTTVTQSAWPNNRVVTFPVLRCDAAANVAVGVTSVSGPILLQPGLYFCSVHMNGAAQNLGYMTAGQVPVCYRTNATTYNTGYQSLGAVASGYTLPSPFPVAGYGFGLTGNMHRIEMLLEAP